MKEPLRALVIGDVEKVKIKAAIELARGKVNRWEHMKEFALPGDGKPVRLEDKKPSTDLSWRHTSTVNLPVGYTCCFSFEEQPAGIFRHLSIAVDTVGKLPGPAAIKMISEVFGLHDPDHGWLEEFEPGHYAVNLVELEPPTETKQ